MSPFQRMRKCFSSIVLVLFSIQLLGLPNIFAATIISTVVDTGGYPRSVFIDSSDNVYITKSSANIITRISSTGVVSTHGTTGSNPWGMTMDSTGNLYVTNSTDNTVTKITPAGVSSVFGTTGAGPRGIAIDSLGNIYTANQTAQNVTKITPAGVSSVFGTTGAGPYSIVIDSTGNLYVTNGTDNTVTKITPAGVSSVFGTTGAGPRGIAIDSLGNIYTANQTAQNVTKITPAGVSSVFGTTGASSYNITIDVLDNLYVSSQSNANVLKFTPAGVKSVFGTGGATPYGIAIDSSGIIYTANYISNNVIKIGPAPNTAPTDITLSGTTVNDGASAPIVVGTLSTTDPDVGDTHTYFLNRCTVPGADDLLFSRSGSELSLNITPDYTTQSSYNICIRTVDAGGLFYDKNFVISVIDITPPLAPTILTPGSGSTLQDNTPTFSGTGEVGTTVTLTVGGQTLTGTVDASGNWSITPTTPLSDGLHTVTVTLTDTSGNMSPASSRIFTVDTTAPVLTLSGSASITLPFGGAYTEYGARWIDSVDGSGSLAAPYTGSVNPSIAGTYTLTYRYTDRAGNTSTVTRTVTVQAYVGPGGGGGGGSSSYSPSVPVTPSQLSTTGTVIPPSATIPPEYQIQLLPTQSQVVPSGLNKDGQLIYTIENRITDYICPQIVQVYTEDELKAQDISAASLFSDDIKSVIMFRGLERDEQTTEQTFLEYKRFGITINDGAFEPTRNVTRAEYVKMLVRALSCRYQKEGTNTPFSDVDENMWHAEYINFATNHGWINGYQDGTFRPDAPITRAEAAKILANAIQLETNMNTNTQNIHSSFSDVPDNSVFTPYIEALRDNKIISGRTPTTYAPDAYIPRTEASRLVYRTFLGGNN